MTQFQRCKKLKKLITIIIHSRDHSSVCVSDAKKFFCHINILLRNENKCRWFPSFCLNFKKSKLMLYKNMTHMLRNQQFNITIESLNWSKLEFINVNSIFYVCCDIKRPTFEFSCSGVCVLWVIVFNVVWSGFWNLSFLFSETIYRKL